MHQRSVAQQRVPSWGCGAFFGQVENSGAQPKGLIDEQITQNFGVFLSFHLLSFVAISPDRRRFGHHFVHGLKGGSLVRKKE
jgi:hypothetical protein